MKDAKTGALKSPVVPTVMFCRRWNPRHNGTECSESVFFENTFRVLTGLPA